MNDWFATEGSPSPLGVTWVPADEAFNFAHRAVLQACDRSDVAVVCPGDALHPCRRLALDAIANTSGRFPVTCMFTGP
jgi:hypothetical protein